MASEVDIANLALSHIGDDASVSSLDPPEQTPQAMHCARFYPIARDALLEMFPWGFASRRATLAQLVQVIDQWDYQYACPPDMMVARHVIAATAAGDTAEGGAVVPKPFVIETDSSGVVMICTDVEDAILLYQAYVTNTAKFPPQFVMALSWLLASMLAGPIIKGDSGRQEAARCETIARQTARQAQISDSGQRNVPLDIESSFTRGR